MSCTWRLRVAFICAILNIYRDSPFAPGGTVSALDYILLVGETCNSIAKCQEHNNVFCLDHICACNENWAASSDGLQCLPMLRGLGDSCEVDGQCTSKLGDNSWCHDGVCDCTELAVPVRGVCQPKPTDADPRCSENIQCSEVFGDKSLCVNMECGCMEGYHVTKESNICLEDKGLRDQCLSDDECFLTSDGTEQNISCIDNSCACAEGYQPSDANHRCLAADTSAAYHLAPVLSTLIGLLFAVVFSQGM